MVEEGIASGAFASTPPGDGADLRRAHRLIHPVALSLTRDAAAASLAARRETVVAIALRTLWTGRACCRWAASGDVHNWAPVAGARVALARRRLFSYLQPQHHHITVSRDTPSFRLPCHAERTLAKSRALVTPKVPPPFEPQLLLDGVGAGTKVNRIANGTEIGSGARLGRGPISSLKNGGTLGGTGRSQEMAPSPLKLLHGAMNVSRLREGGARCEAVVATSLPTLTPRESGGRGGSHQ